MTSGRHRSESSGAMRLVLLALVLVALAALGWRLLGKTTSQPAVIASPTRAKHHRASPSTLIEVSISPSATAHPSTSPAAQAEGPIPKPHIVYKPIPFGAQRQAETARYDQRHYGLNTWKLIDPKVIVEHYTVSSTASSAWSLFAANVPDLGELPGTCSQFIVDENGTICQLVPLDTVCRHTVGLNYTAFGIENVGMSDQQILHNPKELQATLHLTLWLMQQYGIPLGNVIGHAESQTLPYYKDLLWHCQYNHSDWLHPDMQIYRADLAALAKSYGIKVGPNFKPVNNCG